MTDIRVEALEHMRKALDLLDTEDESIATCYLQFAIDSLIGNNELVANSDGTRQVDEKPD